MKNKTLHEKKIHGAMTGIEAGLTAFRSLRSAREERAETLAKLVEPFREAIQDALKRGAGKKAVLSTLNELIGRRLTGKQLETLLHGKTRHIHTESAATLFSNSTLSVARAEQSTATQIGGK